MANYPNTIQLGSVVDVTGYDLPKIDLLIGGSPCQSFSFAGKRKGMSTKDEQEILTLEHYLQLKSECYEFEGQSYLFWEYMRLIYEVKPKYFLLENVMMGEKWEKVLSKAIGVNPIMINSSLVSAQNRKRLYWTNIGMESAGLFGYPVSIIDQPKDKGILLKDILQSDVDQKFFLKQNFKNERLKTNLIKHKNELKDLCLLDSYNQAIYYDKSITVSTRVNASSQTHIYINSQIRRLTPIECERLQTVKDNYTNYVSDSHRYRMLGNGWTVDVIAHIFGYLK
jgi:DNA (cytosine-5)-methyltransferase 3A